MAKLPKTDRAILALPAPTDKRYEMYRDEAVQGLVLRIMKSGHRAWVLERRLPNKSKQEISLGPGDSLTLSEAREACIKEMARIRDLEPPPQPIGDNTFGAAFEDYCLARRIIPTHAKDYRRVLEVYGQAIWNLPIDKLTRRLVLATRKSIEEGNFEPGLPYTPEKGGAAKANDFIRYGGMVYSWARRGADNPFSGIDPLPRENSEGNSKKYVFQPKDWPDIFDLIERWGSNERDLFITHIMLGARPKGTCSMRWSRLNLDAGTYTLSNNPEECSGWKPATSPHWDYPLDDYTLEKLRARKEFARPGATFVFPSRYAHRADEPITNRPLESLFRELRQRLSLPDHCTAYAARYTRATYAEIAFGNTQITSRMLNHRLDTGKDSSNATPRYVVTGDGNITQELDLGYKTIAHYVNRYSQILLELAGRRELTDETRRIFQLSPTVD